MTTICYQGCVSGRVQGVFFRTETQRKAEQLGLDGWVRNVDDGSVEVLICGSEADIREMLEWLRQGPPLAVVAEVSLLPIKAPLPTNFKPTGFRIVS
jgi:acylphosphatase